MRMFPPSACAPIVFALALFASGPLEAGVVYLALGDSNAFGIDDSTPSSTVPSYGDQGYVGHFADFLGSINGGARPQVVNLAIPGELSTSFLTGNSPPGWTGREQNLNRNYPAATTSQNSLMLATLGAAQAAGNTVYVTFNVGINDFYYLTTTPAWQAASAAQKQALFANLVGQVAANDAMVLGEIRQVAPTAHIFLPNFYNADQPTDPNYALSEMATVAANQFVQQAATAFGATYVDFYSVIHGNSAQLANQVGSGHLNQAGYAAVALVLDAAAVPEPASVLLLGIGAAGLLARLAGRRAK